MNALLAQLVAWTPFVHPMQLSPGSRLWLFFPIAVCVALVYRATRSNSAREIPRPALGALASLVAGMVALALLALGLHEAVLRFFR